MLGFLIVCQLISQFREESNYLKGGCHRDQTSHHLNLWAKVFDTSRSLRQKHQTQPGRSLHVSLCSSEILGAGLLCPCASDQLCFLPFFPGQVGAVVEAGLSGPVAAVVQAGGAGAGEVLVAAGAALEKYVKAVSGSMGSKNEARKGCSSDHRQSDNGQQQTYVTQCRFVPLAGSHPVQTLLKIRIFLEDHACIRNAMLTAGGSRKLRCHRRFELVPSRSDMPSAPGE